MRGLRALPMLGAALACLAIGGFGGVLNGDSSHAASPGLIVFASDRDKYDPGEIYSLAPGTAPRDVSRSLAPDHGLAVAPVGNLIAFWSSRTGTDRIYLEHADGSRLRLVGGTSAAEAGGGGSLIFSADGSKLFAQWFSSFPPRYKLISHFFRIDTQRAMARPIHPCNGIPQPSPDGALIACGRNDETTVFDLTGRVRFRLPGNAPLWSSQGWLTSAPGGGAQQADASAVVVDSSGAVRAHVTGAPVGWSPDGRWLALGRGGDLWIAGPDDVTRTRLLVPGWGGAPISFTPDSRFLSTQSQQGGFQRFPLAGGRATTGLDGGLGVWSRTGRLAYVGFSQVYAKPVAPGATVAVFVTDARGRNPRIAGRFPFDDHGYSSLYWLPDGKRVLFLTSGSCGGTGLYAVPASGGATRRLNDDPRALAAPAWSPDGTRIAYSAQKFECHLGEGESIHIETMAADGSDPRRVTDDGDPQAGSFDADPSFSPDGGSIAFTTGTFDSSSLQTIALSGGTRTPLLPPGAGGPSSPAWSPDGSKVAYVAAGSSIMVTGPSGGTPQLLVALPARKFCGSGGLAWSPDGTQIAVPGDDGIYLVGLGTAPSARLAIGVRCAEYPSFSPDGNQIAFDAPVTDHPLGGQTAIMTANIDGTGVRTLSTVPFRRSLHPTWQPA